MKTKFSNAEKVSDNFLKTKYEELFIRVKAISWKPFLRDLEGIYTLGNDNYEKLKQIIHLERDFDLYLRSKEFLFDVFRMEFSDTIHIPYVSKCGLLGEAAATLDERGYGDNNFLQFCIDKLLSGKAFYNENVTQGEKEDAYIHISLRYLNSADENDVKVFKYLFKNLTDEDIKEIEKIIHTYFKNLFRRILKTSEVKLEAETDGKLSKDIRFKSDLSTNTLLYITKINMEVYWEDFDYREDDERANQFKAFINQCLEKDIAYFARKGEFWYLLLNFRDFCINIESVSEEQIEEAKKNLAATEKAPKRKKVAKEELDEVLKNMIWNSLDFSGLDLSDVKIGERAIVNCNFENTGIMVDLITLNANTYVHYINGVQFDRNNLINSCFKGCTVFNANIQTLNRFIFSSDTFDDEVALKCDYNLEFAGEDIKEKYFRKILPSESELEVLFLCGVDAVRRYGELINHSKYTWLLSFDRVSKESDIVVQVRKLRDNLRMQRT